MKVLLPYLCTGCAKELRVHLPANVRLKSQLSLHELANVTIVSL